jgi:hypothetical protein
LTIRWLPGNANSGTYDFVTVYSDSTDTGHYGVDYTAATVGKWSAGDSRVFRLKETDLAGNESSVTRPLLPVPSLVGLTTDQAAAALAAHGFTLGQVTSGGAGPAGTVTGPDGLVLAEQGATIDVTVAGSGALTTFIFKVQTAPRFKPTARKRIAARVAVTRAARVTAELYSPRGGRLYTWRFTVKAGSSIVKLRTPRQVRRRGVYTLRWTARAGLDKVSLRIPIRLVGRGPTTVGTNGPIAVVLAGHATRGVGMKLPSRRSRVVSAPGVDPTFDAAANRWSDVRVIVVDVDEFGVAFVRDLHTVFPSVRIVALSASPKKLASALRAGAVIALPRSVPPATLAKFVQRFLPPSRATQVTKGP